MANRTPSEEKLEKQDFNLFDALDALDRKDYDYWDSLSQEQQRKFVPYMLLQWMSSVRGPSDLEKYYLMNSDVVTNKHLFDETIQKNPKLQWLMLCSISPGLGKQRHEWIPQLSKKITKLSEKAKINEVKEYFLKIYSDLSNEDIEQLSKLYVQEQHNKVYLAKHNPNMKLEDIDVLSKLITPEDIKEYEKDIGN